MQILTLLFLLGSCSLGAVDARANNDGLETKAKEKFRSYQSDQLNLLRGIESGEYESIYIQYHKCVWSEFSDGEDDGEDSGCRGDGDGDDAPWYMGHTPCYRANAAYSLYGVRAGDDEEVPEYACKKRYYINTFFTNQGMNVLGNLLGLENYGDATSQCTLSYKGDDNEDEDDSQQHNAQLYPNAQSYTTYCAGGKFVTTMFNGAYCTGKGDLGTLDTLADLNNELDEVDCVLAYSAEDYQEEAKSGDENGRRLEEEENNDEDEDEEEEEEAKDIWDLLSYSSACSILEYPKGCPDPYGVKRRFGMNPRTSNGFAKHLHGIDWLTLVLFVLGTLLLLLTCAIKDHDPDSDKKKKKRRGFGFGRNRSKSPSKARESKTGSKTSGNNDSDTVNTNGEQVTKKKKGFFRMFSRKQRGV